MNLEESGFYLIFLIYILRSNQWLLPIIALAWLGLKAQHNRIIQQKWDFSKKKDEASNSSSFTYKRAAAQQEGVKGVPALS